MIAREGRGAQPAQYRKRAQTGARFICDRAAADSVRENLMRGNPDEKCLTGAVQGDAPLILKGVVTPATEIAMVTGAPFMGGLRAGGRFCRRAHAQFSTRDSGRECMSCPLDLLA